MLMPSSAGTMDTDCDAKFTPLLNAINRKAITIMCGSVPIIPPIFVPCRSAINVINMTIKVVSINGITDCIRI